MPGIIGERAQALDRDPSLSPEAVRGLVWTLVRTDFKARYHGTVGGYAWALLKPLAMFVVLVVVFSFLFRTDPDYRFNLICGLFLWDFFAESTRSGLGALHAKGFLIAKARFPHWIVVLVSSANALITVALFSFALLAALAITGRAPGPVAVVLYLFYLTSFAGIVWGFSLAASVLFLRYRDLNQLWDLALQAGFFVAPVVYPLDVVPERLHLLLYCWPPTSVIQFSRDVLIRGLVPSATAHLLLAVAAIASLGLGALTFRWLAPRAVETL